MPLVDSLDKVLRRRARGLATSCALALICAASGCGVPELVSYTPREAECTTDADCDDSDPCSSDQCVESVCKHSTVDMSDNDACTIDACEAGKGITHTAKSLDDNDACTKDECDPITGVSHTPINPADGTFCTVDTCDPKTGPVHTPVPVDDGDLCTVDACDPATGVVTNSPLDPAVFDDGDACTIDTCDPVVGAIHTVINPDDGNACTADACDPMEGVSHATTVCPSEGDAESCTLKICDPADGMCKAYDQALLEDFEAGSGEWTLDMQWQIGDAMASSGQQAGSFPDPSQDFDGPVNGNGVAGVVIGGNATSTGGATIYLTSPVVDLSSLPLNETLYLDFWRYLNTAAPPLMTSTIEVWDGGSWVELWKNGAALSDPIWQNFSVPVTDYKSKVFQVRFGLSVTPGAPVLSSWNIDHVRLIRLQDKGC